MLRLAAALLCISAPVLTGAEPAAAWDGLKSHAAPRPLAADAKTEDWPRFLGPANAPVSGETRILQEFPPAGPTLLWECRRGSGYAAPAIAAGRLVHFHNLNGRETIECLEPETGKRFWSHSYPIEYTDDFGYGDGPRAGPVISGESVITFGVTSRLTCLDLMTGKVRWERDCQEVDGVPKYFFGSGAAPLVKDGLVICHLGGAENLCVAAFALTDGTLKWKTVHEWGQSYASPIPATLHGKERVLVFAGGKSKPSTGGLLNIDPATGTADGTFFWRASRYPSVNASSPVLCGGNRVFISQSYVDRESDCNGGVMLEVAADGTLKPLWKNAELGCHWMTPVHADGQLYAFTGEKDRQCPLVCHDVATGKRLWTHRFEWEHDAGDRKIPMGLMRASLLRVGDRYLCQGEWGTLAWLRLTAEKPEMLSRCQPFMAEQTWTLPCLSRGLLYVCQNDTDRLNGQAPRLLCYDLRASAP